MIRASAVGKKFWKKPRREQSEAQLHRTVAAFLRVALKPPTIWTTIGHGGGGRVRGAQLKAMGVQKGWPDILVIDREGEFSLVLGIELKAPKGRISDEQADMQLAFAKIGGCIEICRSVEQVEQFLRANLIKLHATALRQAA